MTREWEGAVRRGSIDELQRLLSEGAYELGPEPAIDDIDGRAPSVVTWHDGEMFYLIASGQMSADDLIKIANSLYE
jgi:hypothetical protein